MKPISCINCGYMESVKVDDKDFYICMKTNRFLDEDKGKRRADDCPLDKRIKEDADKKGFYLMGEYDNK